MKSFRAPALLSLTLLVCVAAKLHLQKKLEHFSHKEVSLAVVNAGYYGRSLRHYGLGFDNLIADLIWIDLLQRASHEKLENNKVSWEYAQLEAITALDPNFLRAYSFGASFLSVFRQDKLGAKLLLEKWVKREPNYWHSHYILGYHLYYEMHDYAAAYPHMLKAAELPGAPAWLTSLGVRILSESGALANALKISIDLFDTLQNNEEGQIRLASQIRSLRFALQKRALEEALESWSPKRFHPGGIY